MASDVFRSFEYYGPKDEKEISCFNILIHDTLPKDQHDSFTLIEGFQTEKSSTKSCSYHSQFYPNQNITQGMLACPPCSNEQEGLHIISIKHKCGMDSTLWLDCGGLKNCLNLKVFVIHSLRSPLLGCLNLPHLPLYPLTPKAHCNLEWCALDLLLYTGNIYS